MKSLSINKSLFLIFLILFLVGCGGGGNNTQTQSDTNLSAPENIPDYDLIWSDEFDGDSINASNWTAEKGYGNSGWGNDESQLYTDSKDNLTVKDGNLIITARCPSGNCGKRDGSITSARIITKDKFEFKYGKVKARIKVPEGESTWPAFWMLGANFPDTQWPASGEIDIMEVSQEVANINTALFAMHFCNDNRTDCETDPYSGWEFYSDRQTLDQPLSEDFHEYELDWNQNSIVGKVDGVTYFIQSLDEVTMREFMKEFFLILNVAVDGTLGKAPNAIKTTPQEMLVDWVRVYKAVNPDIPLIAPSLFDSGLLINGDFESRSNGWIGNASYVTNELLGFDGSKANFANVVNAGNPWDVNLSQVVNIVEGESYSLSFKVKSNGTRSMIAGIGLNEQPYTNDSRTINLSTEWQTYELALSSSSFGGTNSRVFFDMGADTGQVIIDEVSLVKVED